MKLKKIIPCLLSILILAQTARAQTGIALEYTELQRVAFLSDYGCDNPNEEIISKLIKSWNPQIIISCGNDNYALSNDSCGRNIDENVGKYYADYIYPYSYFYEYDKESGYSEAKMVNKSYRSKAAPDYNRFYSVPGNHDFEGGLSAWLNYFQHGANTTQHPMVTMGTSSGAENKKFYEFKFQVTLSPDITIHFFGLNVWQKDVNSGCIDDEETPEACNDMYYNSIAVGSEQYEWLKQELQKSSSQFKVVFMHKSPYSSLSKGSSTKYLADQLKLWDFYKWGADLVIAGNDHYFEVNYRDNLPFVVNGLGGISKKNISDQYLASGNIFHYDDEPGFLILEAIKWNTTGQYDLRLSFQTIKDWSIGGQTVYEHFLNKTQSRLFVRSEVLLWNQFLPYHNQDVIYFEETGLAAMQFKDVNNSYLQWVNPPSASSGIDPSGDGYTISYEIQPYDLNDADSQRPFYTMWFLDEDSTLLSGIKRVGRNLLIDRYNDLVYPTKSYEMALWRPNLFDQGTAAWYRVFISVKEDMIRIKVYDSFLENSALWGELGTGGKTELTYMGGQSLAKAKFVGFGKIPGTNSRSESGMKNFKVYDRALDFRSMDLYFKRGY